MRRVKIDRFGIENVVGAHVTWKNGRQHTAEVTGIIRNSSDTCWMLETRYFDGSQAPTVAAGAVQVLER